MGHLLWTDGGVGNPKPCYVSFRLCSRRHVVPGWRLEAIGLYLSLGFEPQMTRDDMPDRWSDIMQKLGK